MGAGLLNTSRDGTFSLYSNMEGEDGAILALRQVFIPAVLCLINIAPHCVHEGVVVPIHLTVGRRPIWSVACFVYLEQLADSAEELTLEIPSLVRENLVRASKTRELIDCCRSGNLSCLGGQGDTFHPLGELVDHHQDILITPCCSGQGSQKT